MDEHAAMQAFKVCGFIVVCVATAACSSQESQGTPQALAGFCQMSGADRVVRGRGMDRLSFDTATGAISATSLTSGPESGELVATATESHCVREAAGPVAWMGGSGDWNSVPGHQFILHAAQFAPDVATPVPGIELVTASLQVISPSGEIVHSVGGFVDTAFDVVAAPLPGGPSAGTCAVTGSVTLTTRDRLTIDAREDAGSPGTGRVEIVGAPGGGPRARITIDVTGVLCQVDGAELFDAVGPATVDGIAGHTGRVHIQSFGSADQEDFVRVSVRNARGELVFATEGDAPPQSFAVIVP